MYLEISLPQIQIQEIIEAQMKSDRAVTGNHNAKVIIKNLLFNFHKSAFNWINLLLSLAFRENQRF